MDKSVLAAAKQISKEFLHFVNDNISAYHVTAFCRQQLLNKGFKELSEASHWELQKGEKYFFTKNESTLFAFTIGNHFQADKTGFKIIGAHTDSPCLKLAPVSKMKVQDYHQNCVCTYGGGLWHTWLDRDLTLGGKVVHFDSKSQKYVTSLFNAKRALFRIPNLAIHLQTATERGKLDLNNETHLKPIFATEVSQKLFAQETEAGEDKHGILKKHYGGLLGVIAEQLNIKETDIIDLDLNFADTQPAQLLGLHEEFISAPRIDNQMCSFLSLKAMIEQDTKDSSWINVITLFDHEECGSESAQGANSQILPETLKRIYSVLSEKDSTNTIDGYQQAISRSFQISADMAHAIHPNYTLKHQDNHQIKINQGVGIKVNFNQAYATDCVSASILKLLAEKKQIPIQEFIVRNDSPCGSTVGRFVSALTGIKTIDVGNPQLSMHSIRETCGVVDTLHCFELFKLFFEEYENLPVNILGK